MTNKDNNQKENKSTLSEKTNNKKTKLEEYSKKNKTSKSKKSLNSKKISSQKNIKKEIRTKKQTKNTSPNLKDTKEKNKRGFRRWLWSCIKENVGFVKLNRIVRGEFIEN